MGTEIHYKHFEILRFDVRRPVDVLSRTDDVPNTETMARVFDDADKVLVAQFRLSIPVFRAVTTKLYNLLKPLIIQGSYYSFILPVILVVGDKKLS
jgi:hypothetical protein